MMPAFAALAAAGPAPHLIMELADDYGWNNIGLRNPEVKTPAIDSLAAGGVSMERMYAFKYCSPTRSSILSGRLPLHVTQNNKNNLLTNPGGADLRMALLPQKLRAAGYRSVAVGKWHVGARSTANLPINRGFDAHFGFLKGGEDHRQNQTDPQNTPSGDPAPGPAAHCVDLWRDLGPACAV